jgi:hypothetical protein
VEKLTFTRMRLSIIRVIVAILCVPLMELLCSAAMGYILALEYQLSVMVYD